MNFRMSTARAKTALDSLFHPFAFKRARDDAARVWAEIRPALTLSGEPALTNRMARFARNILAATLPSPVRYLEIGVFEGASLALVHALLKGRVASTMIDPFENYDELPSVDMPAIGQRFLASMQAAQVFIRQTAP